MNTLRPLSLSAKALPACPRCGRPYSPIFVDQIVCTRCALDEKQPTKKPAKKPQTAAGAFSEGLPAYRAYRKPPNSAIWNCSFWNPKRAAAQLAREQAVMS